MRTFTSLDLAVVSNKNLQHLDTSTLWASFGSESLLSIIRCNFEKLKIVYKYLADLELRDDHDKASTGAPCHPDLRRITFILYRRKFKEEKNELRAVTLIGGCQNPSYRDMLIKIGRLSPDFSLD